MGWVPTAQRFKAALVKSTPPTADIQFKYNVQAVYLKLAISVAVMTCTVLIAMFVFTKSFSGISLLHGSAAKKSDARKKVVKASEELTEDSISELISALKER